MENKGGLFQLEKAEHVVILVREGRALRNARSMAYYGVAWYEYKMRRRRRGCTSLQAVEAARVVALHPVLADLDQHVERELLVGVQQKVPGMF